MSEGIAAQLERLEATYMAALDARNAKIKELEEQLEDAEDAAARAERELGNQYAKELRSTGRCPFCGAQQ